MLKRFWLFVVCLPVWAESLETRVWNNPDLFTTEQEIVRKIQVNPSDAYAHYLLSVLKTRGFMENPLETTDQHLAIQLAQQSIDLQPDSDMGFMAMAHALDAMGRTKQAVTLMNRVLNGGFLLSWRYYFTLARISGEHIESPRVLSLLKQALDLKGSEPDIIMPFMIATLQSSQDDRLILTELQSLRQSHPHDLIDYYIAVHLAKLKEFQTSFEMFTRLSSHPQWGIEAQLNAAMISYQFLQKSKNALKIFEALLTRQDISRAHLADVHSHLGVLALQDKKKEKSLTHFRHYLRLAEDTIPSLEFVITQNRQHGFKSNNVSMLEFLLENIQPSGILFAMLGEVFAEDLGDFKKSERAFLNAVTLNPERADFYSGLGVVYYRSKEFEKAQDQFKEAVRLDPSNATAMYNLACVLAIGEKTTEAMKFLEESLNLDPELIQIARSDEDLKSLVPLKGFRDLLQRHSLSH
jgi:tetratricopeptide (TPR) repeat protein